MRIPAAVFLDTKDESLSEKSKSKLFPHMIKLYRVQYVTHICIPHMYILGSRVLDKDLPFCLSKNRLLIELVKVQKSRRRKGKRDQKRDLDPFSSSFLFSLCNMFFLGTSIIFPFCKLLQNLIG